MQLTNKELLKDAEHRVYVDHLSGNVPNVVHDLCNEAEILVNAAMDSDVMLALAAYEAGRLAVGKALLYSPSTDTEILAYLDEQQASTKE